MLRGLARRLPSEHGFWVMLSAALLGGLLRARASAIALAVALLVGVLAVLAGALLHRRIRKSSAQQLASALALALAFAPVAWAGGAPTRAVLGGVAAWASIFVASALLVQAAFARSARARERRALTAQLSALALLLLTTLALAAVGQLPEASACATASVGCFVLSWFRFDVKELKALGLGLTATAFTATLSFAL